MLFNSYEFIFVFLPIVIGGYVVFRRWWLAESLWLVGASIFFYGWWNPIFLWVILLSVSVNFLCGKRLSQTPSRWILWLGIIFNLALLGYFKYTNFMIDVFNDVAEFSIPAQNIILPLAISFFTFQQIAYLVDSYRRLTVPHNAVEYVLFVTFFPQLIAGPIVHQAEILPQLRKPWIDIDYRGVAEGLALFTIGLSKKVLIADNISPFSTEIFSAAMDPTVTITFFEAWSGALAYTFQLYFDFSGYCDMALGAGRIFGIRLPINFNSPYKARDITDFWRRWHMTLSRFLRDYLYFPLGGNRYGSIFQMRNLLIVMLLGGLWHGAAWNFVIWGALHGIYLLVNRVWKNWTGGGATSRPGRALAWLLTFIAVVVGWVFFRAESLDAAFAILKGMTGVNGMELGLNHQSYLGSLGPLVSALGVNFVPITRFSLIGALWILGCLAITLFFPNSQDWVTESNQSRPENILTWTNNRSWGAAIGLGAAISVGYLSKSSEFLYFNF
ncbi:MAG: MBOAT family protein [Rhodospirillales bacterium]|nr:MBOAT family protein [Rhodospirillales bacterium]